VLHGRVAGYERRIEWPTELNTEKRLFDTASPA
jgi:hypothetical protein